MRITRLGDAQRSFPPNHVDCASLMLQGHAASPTANFTVSLSHYLPTGHTTHEATPFEKVYVVVNGAITVITDDGEATLHPFDSCRIAPDEARTVENRTNEPASMIVIMPYPDGPR